MTGALWRGLFLAALLCGGARADLFSPGELSRAHQGLEGIKNCTQCHVAGKQLSASSCLSCHVELKDRVAQGLGFHGKLEEEQKNKCESCHQEHQGRDFKLVDWGSKGKANFDHARTGFALFGKHAQAQCSSCHDARLIEAAPVKRLLAERAGRETFLGLGVRCLSCHFDEHRGQEAQECKSCHDERGWKPARFAHAKAGFALTGAHLRVDCEKCHVREKDPAHAGAFPRPVSEVFSRFKPVSHQSCTACHQDPHDNRLGQRCTDCHLTESWKQVTASTASSSANRDRQFHDGTRYPLQGAHLDLACASCHGAGRKAVFKGLAFARCTDCHSDAHQGQLGKAGDAAADCRRCHVLGGFAPARFEVEEHAKTHYPLEGAHAAVACLACHLRDEARVQKLALAPREKVQPRAVKLSPALFVMNTDVSRCNSCHRDVHGGQFAAKATGKTSCESCHLVDSFHAVQFDHAKTRFPLEGKHARAACAQCHFAKSPGAPIAYRGLELACASCHLDVHAGQFAQAGKRADCARCHGVDGFEKAAFVHAPPQAQFALEGRHAELSCIACHPRVQVAPQLAAVRYKPLPLSCEGCHLDQHDGAFKRFAR